MRTGTDGNGPRGIRRDDHSHYRPRNPDQLLGDHPRTSGHRHLSAGFGNHLRTLRKRGSDRFERPAPFHHRSGAVQSGAADRRSQRGGCQSRRSHGAAHLRQQKGTLRQERGFAVRPADGRKHAADCQGPARAGRGAARKRRQQPLLYGREGSGQRRGGNAAVPCRRAGKRIDSAAADDRIGQLGRIRLLLDDREPAAQPDPSVRFDRQHAQEHARRTAGAQRRFGL